MSEESVAAVQRLLDAFNRRDVDGFAGETTPDFEWSPSVIAVDDEVLRGRAGIDRYFARMVDAWAEFTALVDETTDLGDRILLAGRIRGRGLSSGAPIDVEWSALFDIRDGRVSRMHSFLDHQEALRAAGLEG